MDTKFKNIRLDNNSVRPIYQQIAEQIQLLIITKQIKVGESLPSIRQLGQFLNINPNTAARAYLELEREQLVIAKRGGGTIVTSGSDDPIMRSVRRNHLFENINGFIIKMLSQGYIIDELEATFYVLMERWREESQTNSSVPVISPVKSQPDITLRIVGSHDIALNMLTTIHKQRTKDVLIDLTNVGSMGGLIALAEDKADLAGIHLLDEETGEYNVPFIKRVLPGQELILVNLTYRIQGLMIAAGNPKNIRNLEDLRRSNIVFVNRQKGSGTRVLLDMYLKRLGICPDDIKGYEVELDSHLTVGSAVAQGKADVGLGIEPAAHACGIDFIPLFRERYDLAIPGQIYRSEKSTCLLDIIKSNEFKNIVNKVEGYDTSETGTEIYVQ